MSDSTNSSPRPCFACGLPIEAGRIDCIPETILCVVHGREIEERFGGEFRVTGKSVSLGKVESFKKNYGDVSFERERNYDGLERLRSECERRTNV